jgi:hypothetical protein
MAQLPPITQNFARPSYRPQEPVGMDPEIKRMVLVAGGFGAALALVIGAFSFSHSHHHGVPVIEALTTPVRVKPLDPGGMQVAGAEDTGVGQAEKLAPPSEKPELRALRAKHLAKATEHPPVPPAPVPQPAPLASAAAPPLPAVQTPIAAVPETVSGGVSVQLAAFESEQAAEQDWGKMAEKMPRMFDGHKPDVVRATLAGRTVYRLRTGGFASIAAATDFCAGIRARHGECAIAAF